MKVNKINMGVFVKFVNFDLQFAQILVIYKWLTKVANNMNK